MEFYDSICCVECHCIQTSGEARLHHLNNIIAADNGLITKEGFKAIHAEIDSINLTLNRSPFAKTLDKTMESQGISNSVLGKTVGINPHQIAAYRKGKTEPSMASLMNLADALNISVDVLLGRKEK